MPFTSELGRPSPAIFDPLAQARYDLAQAQARLMELEDDAQLMRDLKREIKGLDVRLENHGMRQGDGAMSKLAKIWRRIQTEAHMERGSA